MHNKDLCNLGRLPISHHDATNGKRKMKSFTGCVVKEKFRKQAILNVVQKLNDDVNNQKLLAIFSVKLLEFVWNRLISKQRFYNKNEVINTGNRNLLYDYEAWFMSLRLGKLVVWSLNCWQFLKLSRQTPNHERELPVLERKCERKPPLWDVRSPFTPLQL